MLMKKLIPFLFLFLGAILFAEEEKQPNIVIIVCDDLNDSIEGMGGHPQAITPNINRLIKSGVRFTNAASNALFAGLLVLVCGVGCILFQLACMVKPTQRTLVSKFGIKIQEDFI